MLPCVTYDNLIIESYHSGTFGGVKPVYYELKLKLPTTNESHVVAPYGNVLATSTLAFEIVYNTRRVFLNARNINFNSATVNMVAKHTGDSPIESCVITSNVIVQ